MNILYTRITKESTVTWKYMPDWSCDEDLVKIWANWGRHRSTSNAWCTLHLFSSLVHRCAPPCKLYCEGPKHVTNISPPELLELAAASSLGTISCKARQRCSVDLAPRIRTSKRERGYFCGLLQNHRAFVPFVNLSGRNKCEPDVPTWEGFDWNRIPAIWVTDDKRVRPDL